MANKDRIGGWENLHKWFSIAPDGLPYLQFASNCINAIATIPTLIHDEVKVEDINTDGEDHAADSARYGVMSRPMSSEKPVKTPERKSLIWFKNRLTDAYLLGQPDETKL